MKILDVLSHVLNKEDSLVARLSRRLARRCGISRRLAWEISIAARLHDIGKAKIPAEILNKPGKLTGDEFEIVKQHTRLGAKMLAYLPGKLGDVIRNVCALHHERYDSGGYWGVSGSNVPPYVSIVSICDVYVALVSARPYKKAWSSDEALSYIAESSGSQFPPTLVSSFFSLMRDAKSTAAA